MLSRLFPRRLSRRFVLPRAERGKITRAGRSAGGKTKQRVKTDGGKTNASLKTSMLTSVHPKWRAAKSVRA